MRRLLALIPSVAALDVLCVGCSGGTGVRAVRGLLANGGVLYGDTVVTAVTCKSHADDAAMVDGASAAKAAAGKVSKHRDLVLAGCPDERERESYITSS